MICMIEMFGTGSSGFGTSGGGLLPTPSSQASRGLTFGTSAPAVSGTGFGFGSTAPVSGTGFSFGNAPPAFGTSGTSGFGNSTFGAPTTSSFGTSAFGTGGTSAFGAGGTSGFGTGGAPAFGTGGTSAFGTGGAPAFGTGGTSAFGTGGAPAFGTGGMSAFGTGGTSGFGTGGTSAFGTGGASAFGTGGTAPFGTSGFGTGGTAPFGSSSFGTSFGTGGTSTLGTGGSLFGSANARPFSFAPLGSQTSTSGSLFNPGGTTAFGSKPAFGFGGQDLSQVQQSNQLPDPQLALHLAVCAPSFVNNSECDEVVKKWNQLQAFYGVGKGFYHPNLPPVEFTPENPYCRFKVVCYARIPKARNEDGLLHLLIGQKLAEIESKKVQMVQAMSLSIFGGAEVVFETLQSSSDDKTSATVYVQQTLPNGTKQRVPSMDTYRHISALNYNQTLKNLSIEAVVPHVPLSENQMKEYLDNPPRGIDQTLWEQGKRENPDPTKFVPVVVVGFQELQKRFQAQEDHAKVLESNMEVITSDIQDLGNKQTQLKAALQSARWKQANLVQRVLKLVSTQEVVRKRGVPLDKTEEQIGMRLEDLFMHLSQPTQYRGRLNELLAQMSVQQQGAAGNSAGGQRYALVTGAEKDLTEYVAWQQDALLAVKNVICEDLETLVAVEKVIGMR